MVSMSSTFTKFLMLSLSSFSSFSFYLSPYHANVARGSVTKVGGNVHEHLVWNIGCTGNKTYFAGGVWSRETCQSPQKAVGRETPEGFKIWLPSCKSQGRRCESRALICGGAGCRLDHSMWHDAGVSFLIVPTILQAVPGPHLRQAAPGEVHSCYNDWGAFLISVIIQRFLSFLVSRPLYLIRNWKLRRTFWMFFF